MDPSPCRRAKGIRKCAVARISPGVPSEAATGFAYHIPILLSVNIFTVRNCVSVFLSKLGTALYAVIDWRMYLNDNDVISRLMKALGRY
jgi:hypothetical protein